MPLFVKRLPLLITCLSLALFVCACSKNESEPVAGSEPVQLSQAFPQQAEMLETALKEDPNNVDVLIKLGNLYFDWGQDEVSKHKDQAQPLPIWAKAIDYYKRALEKRPDDVNVRVDMATLIEFSGRPDEAISEFRKAIKIDPKHPQARINLISTLSNVKQDYKAAIIEYDALIKAIPDQAANVDLKANVEEYKKLMKEKKK